MNETERILHFSILKDLQRIKNENTELKKSAHDLSLIKWLLKLDWPNLESMSLVPFYDKELAMIEWINLETKLNE